MKGIKDRRPLKPLEIIFDKNNERFSLRLNDENMFPLHLVILGKEERLLQYKKGKKGHSVFLNSV